MKPIAIPKLADLSAEIAELTARRDEIGAKIVVAEKERAALILTIHSKGFLQPAPPTDPAALRVAALLGEVPPPVTPDSRDELAKSAQTIFDLKMAWAVLDSRMRVERSKASQRVLATLQPEYRNRVRAICEAFKSVHEAGKSLREITDRLEADGINWESLGVVAPLAVGIPGDAYCPAGQYLKDACDQGFINRGEIPERLQQ